MIGMNQHTIRPNDADACTRFNIYDPHLYATHANIPLSRTAPKCVNGSATLSMPNKTTANSSYPSMHLQTSKSNRFGYSQVLAPYNCRGKPEILGLHRHCHSRAVFKQHTQAPMCSMFGNVL
jgi:hypothetical protein